MQLKVLLLMILLLSTSSSLARAKQTLLVVGDSLSAAYGMQPEQGWVHLLSERLKKDYPCVQIVNTSITGQTTSQALSTFLQSLDQYKPTIVIIGLGANDGLRGIPLGIAEGNLAKMITLAQKQNRRIILLAMTLPPNYGAVYIKRFEAIYTSLNKRFDVVFVPFLLENIGGDRSLMRVDGLHPNAKAQPMILTHIWPYVQPVLPSCLINVTK